MPTRSVATTHFPVAMWSPTLRNMTQLLAPTLTTMPSTMCTPSNISCNMVADGVLWISPTLIAIKSDVQGNRAIEWVHNKYGSRTADKGKLSFYWTDGLVIPV